MSNIEIQKDFIVYKNKFDVEYQREVIYQWDGNEGFAFIFVKNLPTANFGYINKISIFKCSRENGEPKLDGILITKDKRSKVFNGIFFEETGEKSDKILEKFRNYIIPKELIFQRILREFNGDFIANGEFGLTPRRKK